MRLLLIYSCVLLIFTSCASKRTAKSIVMEYPEFLIEGHRGTRGLMPENTIPGMIKAIIDGSNVLEMDLQFTADGKVVVTHDPQINHLISLDIDGNEIPKEKARKYMIYQMNYNQVRSFDVGSKDYPAYPKQGKLNTYIPELGELIDSVETFIKINNLNPIIYNIEIKASPKGDDRLHPAPAALIKQVIQVLKNARIENRYYIQSFDKRQIQEVKKMHPEIPVAFLTGDGSKSIQQHVDDLGFAPEIFSPHFKIVNKTLIEQSHQMGIKIIPWTVNQKKNMIALIKMGVDGIITDYPNILSELYRSKQ